MGKLFNFIDKETTRNCAGELKAEDLPIHEHHLLYYTKEQCEAMFALAQHNHDDLYYKKIDVYTKGESITNFASKIHQHYASTVNVDTNNFNKNLTPAENTVQKALDKIDDLDLGGRLPPYEQNKILYGKEFGDKWKPSTHLKYTEDNVGNTSSLEYDYKKIKNNQWQRTGGSFKIYYNNEYSAGWSAFAANPHNDSSIMSNISIQASKTTVLGLSNNQKRVSLTLSYLNQNNNIFSIYIPPSPSFNGGSLTIKEDCSIQSSFYKGQGTSPLLVNSQGVFVRSTEQVAKTATALRNINLSEVGGSFNELFTWNDLGISAQISMPGMVQKVVSVTTVYNDNGTWKNIDNFSYQVTALGIQTSGTILRERTQIKITVLYND